MRKIRPKFGSGSAKKRLSAGGWPHSRTPVRMPAAKSKPPGAKSMVGSEELRSDWDIEGTTGYDFLGLVNGLFVDRNRRRAFYRLYEAFTGSSPSFEDLVYESKKLILQTAMSSELNVLAGKLDKISE